MSLALGVEQARQGWLYLLTSPGWENSNHVAFLGDNNGVAVGMLMLGSDHWITWANNEKQVDEALFSLAIHWLSVSCTLYLFTRRISRCRRNGRFLVAKDTTQSRDGSDLLLLSGGFMLPEAFWIRVGSIETYEENQDASALGRLHFWAVAVKMANANPLLGVGYTGFNPAYDKYDFSAGAYGTEKVGAQQLLGVYC